MNPNEFIKNILTDTKIKVSEEFDKNFNRKAFFDKPWNRTKLANSKGSLMIRSGNLRRSITSRVSGDHISWSSSMPYAKLQNEGGEIIVTVKMKKFFWAMFYKSEGAVGKGATKRNQSLAAEAQQWKFLAMKKVGSKIRIPQRKFIGSHPNIGIIVKNIVDYNLKDLEKYITQKLKK